MSSERNRANYLRREIEIAHQNANAFDTAGQYAAASWWESRERFLREQLKAMEEGREIE